METRDEQQIWDRIRSGRHTACLGLTPAYPPPGLNLVRIRCDGPPGTFGPLFEAQRDVEEILGETGPLLGQARQRVIAGLRRRLLGDLPATGSEAELVDACNRLARQASQPYALVFEALDAADDTTLELLGRLVQRPGWLRMPLLLVFRHGQPSGRAARLLDALRAVAGLDAVIAAPVAAAPDDADRLPPVAWNALPPDVVRVLRAGAVIGSGFEAELIAALLDWKQANVYDCLQRAADVGVPIEDHGDGRFFLPGALATALRDSLLPSVAAAWHRQLGMLLAGVDDAPEAVTAFEPTAPIVSAASQASDAPDVPEAASDTAGAPVADGAVAEAVAEADRGLSYADVFAAGEALGGGEDLAAEDMGDARAEDASADDAPAAEAVAEEAVAEEAVGPADDHTWPAGAAVRAPMPGPRRDQARAAGHLTAAGEIESAAEHYLVAASQAAAVGAHAQAMAHVRRALTLVERLPTTPERRIFRIRALLSLGRIQWQAVDPATLDDGAFTLSSALGTADAVIETLHAGDPPQLVAEACTLVAGICYDLGDLRSLERALDELTRASRLLLEADDPIGAARLLNDQAAVYVRLGDPVQATHLLTQSQAVFESRAESDPVTMTELAETHHLFARLPLHARIRPGHEAEAHAMGLDHARMAEGWYRRLSASRELARVWETMGRLELCRKRLDRASEHLSSALQVQSRLGDVTGLARTTAAMAEVLAARSMHRNALMVLGDSIALNLDKGSPIGLAFNRQAYDVLARDLSGHQPAEVMRALAEVSQRLEQAESLLGRAVLPNTSAG